MGFEAPPRVLNERGEIRRVGFEFEFCGLSIAEAAELIAATFGGKVVHQHHFRVLVEETPFGTFTVESDSDFLKKKRYELPLSRFGLDGSQVERKIEVGLERLTQAIIPHEIVTPPIPLDRLAEVERLRVALQHREAKGTKVSILAGFGLHLNPEVPALDADLLTRTLRAFFLLYGWLFEEAHVNPTRRVLPYIKEFPAEYVALVLDPGYAPDMTRLIDDYLRLTPTRNRPLDLLPMLAMVDRDKVLAASEEAALVKPRPAYHYRLPNCDLDDPEWSVMREWNLWVDVERLAEDTDAMERLYRRVGVAAGDAPNPRDKRWVAAARELFA